ncbi:MAG: restriction endonuclease subunit S [Smithella sp.]|jgi:type I restriction enzyme S subunit
MKSWAYIKLKDYCEIFPGFAFDSSKFTSIVEDIHLVKGENLHQGYIDWENAKRWPMHEWHNLKKFQLRSNDIVVAMDRPWIEAGLKWSVIKQKDPKALLVQRVARLRAREGLNQSFLKHVIGSKLFEGYIKPIVTGVNVPHISGTQIGNFKFSIPNLPIQRKIAAVLSAYDDLIENNNRRIAILERMAEELYREWFVRLRFPGHEKTKIVKGVPEGWEVKTLGEICFEERKLIKKKNISDETRYIGLEHISPRTIITKDYGYAVDIQSDKLVFSKLDILFGKIRPYLHKVSIAHFNGVCSSDIIVIKSRRPENQAFVYLTVSSNSFIDLATTASTGTKMPRADWDFLIKQKIIYPENGLLKQFQKIFDNSLSAIFNYQKRNEMLQHSRDRLLSRLMSGKIDVANLDIQFPDSMKEDAAANA